MARVKISIPSNKIYETQLSVRVNDINYGNHLSNDALLRFAHEVRLRFLNELSFDELNFYGGGLIMSDAALQYKNEGFLFDQLHCELYIDEITTHGFEFVYKFIRSRDKATICVVKTGMVFFNYETKKIASCPQGFVDKYKGS
ncbi:thioesterase family protein [Halobacteriovorax sp. GB3]|uniref:acyl-CoA thioesterase n=1 Tax=Halobacteriovorax sp. GB3 TaxID=2719615 RepID=UPI00235E29E3|nr:thioesterase family protein [Halobacteriovorax sp. GB3]MDD0852826.1 thioesterase family protein [Halobacteriovorax sp. GB3]